jgi:hypothetical protein
VLTAGCVKAPASHATGCHLVGPAPGTPVCVHTLTQHTLIKWPAHSCLLKGSWHGWEHRARLVTYPESGTLGPVQQTPIKAPSAGCRPLPVRCVAAAMLGHPHMLLIVLLSGGVAVVLLHSTCVCWSVVWVGGGCTAEQYGAGMLASGLQGGTQRGAVYSPPAPDCMSGLWLVQAEKKVLVRELCGLTSMAGLACLCLRLYWQHP